MENNYLKGGFIFDLTIIGGGPGGMAAAVKAHELGVEKILLIERDQVLGGILPQCIHGGFGLKIFNSELTGPEYSQIYADRLKGTSVEILLNTMALEIKDFNEFKAITIANKSSGFSLIKTKAIILALGCRERTAAQINITGSRPAGVFTAGLVQRMVNIEGYLPGREIIILGSGDIGLIMARRLHLEGCKVLGVYEINPFSTGLVRNISQCLEDFEIPLFFNHTVTNIFGEKRLSSVSISKVDKNLNPLKGTEKTVDCDSLLLSVGLIPENELSKTCKIKIDENTKGPAVNEYLQTSVEGVFSCGNSLFVNDIVDNVTEAGYLSAESAAEYLEGKLYKEEDFINIEPGLNIAYAVPQKVTGSKDVSFQIRVKKPATNAYLCFGSAFFKKKYKILIPGEMVSVDISRQDIEKLKKDGIKSLRIDVKTGAER